MLLNCDIGEDSSESFGQQGNQSWIFTGRTDAESEAPILWPPHAKSWLIRKDSDAGRGWGQEEKGTTEDEMAIWHHWLDGRESEWTLGVGDGQGGLACCDSWGCKTEWLKWTELKTQLLLQILPCHYRLHSICHQVLPFHLWTHLLELPLILHFQYLQYRANSPAFLSWILWHNPSSSLVPLRSHSHQSIIQTTSLCPS